MQTIRVTGQIDELGRLTASIPESLQPGTVEVLIIARNGEEDEAGDNWMAGVAREWHEDLNDSRQDIYTLADGVPSE